MILCAGNATADIFELFKNENGNAFNFPQMQQRGLQMVMLESKSLPALSAHRLGLGASPLLTISHHQTAINTPVWYLGGEISEKYIHLAPKELIAIAKKQLKKLIPWRDFDDARWSTLKINRAEPKTKDGSRPNEPFVDNCEGVLTCWPIKMAMSPILFAQIQQQLQSLQILPQKGQLDVEQSQWQSFERPAIASMPWDRDNEWYE